MSSIAAGVGRCRITPYWGVELAGWGYYLNRTWKRIHDDLHATALVLDDGHRQVCLVALDLMVIGGDFTQRTRDRIGAETGISPEAILLACSHSHNAPASGGLLGVGEVDPFYEEWASKQAATAATLAWQNRAAALLSTARADLPGITFNRTRPNGPVDTRLATLRVDLLDGQPLAVVVNFQAHPTVHTILRPFEVSRDVPGEVCDYLEAALPGATALYLQGACGDVNFLREYSTPERCREPARLIARLALESQTQARVMKEPVLAHASETVLIPTRRWRHEEIEGDRDEAQRRLATGDTSHWEETIGRAMTNNPKDMVARHGGNVATAVRAMCRFRLEWTELMLRDWQTRPETLATEVQALRIGDLYLVANSTELFTPFALDLRARGGVDDLIIACYANGRIGYLPDAHDITRRSYAAYQSPKYCNQFPFTEASGPALVEGMLRVLQRCRDEHPQ